MQYKFIITTFCICSTFSLSAEKNKLGDILQQVGQKEALVKPVPQKKKSKKKSHFIFVDRYDANGIGSKNKEREKKKSESYEYTNKSRFKFKINDGSPQSNMMGGQSGVSPGMGSGGGQRSGGSGGGRH